MKITGRKIQDLNTVADYPSFTKDAHYPPLTTPYSIQPLYHQHASKMKFSIVSLPMLAAVAVALPQATPSSPTPSSQSTVAAASSATPQISNSAVEPAGIPVLGPVLNKVPVVGPLLNNI